MGLSYIDEHGQKRSAYYDMDSQPITFEQFAALFPDGLGEKTPDGLYRSPRHVDVTGVTFPDGSEGRVSTVLLGTDHNYFGEGPPVIFETMVFGGENEFQERYCYKDEAQAGHDRVVQQIKDGTFAGYVSERDDDIVLETAEPTVIKPKELT